MLRTALALGLENRFGYPPALQRTLSHPVVWVGTLIAWLEARLNRPDASPGARRRRGVASLLAISALGWGFGLALETLARRLKSPLVLVAILAVPGLAAKSLRDHVEAVREPLESGDLPTARAALARIVGRDVETLDVSGVAGAALESLAESFNDGVAAPAFWLCAAGLPGLYLYKAVNTADSMIGHREPRWRDFGWAAARGDDLLNLAPARLAGALLALTGGGGGGAMVREAGRHASPNAGWPEAAMAGALRVRLGGTASYEGELLERPTFGAEHPAPTAADLGRGLRLYQRSVLALTLLLLGIGLVRGRRA